MPANGNKRLINSFNLGRNGVGIDAISGGATNVAIDLASTDQVVAAGSESTETTGAADEVKAVPIGILIQMVFQLMYTSMGTTATALQKIVQGRLDKIADLTKLLNGLDTWNDPPGVPKMPADPSDPVYQDRIAKTDALLLDGVSIPQGDYDYAKYSYGPPPRIGYAKLPIADFATQKTHVPGELYSFPKDGSPTEKTYARYLYTDINPVLREASSPLPLNIKTTPGSDFSAYQPGDLVLDQETQKYYRVAKDKTGVEVEDYPLQKIIYAPDSNVIADLKNQIDNVLVEARDLSKKDALDAQDLSGRITTNSTALANLQSALTVVLNAVARNIHS